MQSQTIPMSATNSTTPPSTPQATIRKLGKHVVNDITIEVYCPYELSQLLQLRKHVVATKLISIIEHIKETDLIMGKVRWTRFFFFFFSHFTGFIPLFFLSSFVTC
jgi:hypothetical protein